MWRTEPRKSEVKDPYEILEIKGHVNSDDVRKAYLELALKYHPDKRGGDKDDFKNVENAYEGLISGGPTVLPDGWVKHDDPISGRPYYENMRTGVITYVRPR